MRENPGLTDSCGRVVWNAAPIETIPLTAPNRRTLHLPVDSPPPVRHDATE
jgi:hypothetical protein